MHIHFQTGLLTMALGLMTLGCEAVEAGEADDSQPITLKTADALLFMGEEEKLARDVYLKNAERYDLQIFSNIADAEQRHMDAVIELIGANGLHDPTQDAAVGQFINEDLATLYTALDARSQISEVEALKVGAEIEEIDILDLIRLSEDADIRTLQTFDNLRRGSRNHLRAYVRQLKSRGVDYQPLHLSMAQFAQIIESEQARDQGHRMNKRGRGRR